MKKILLSAALLAATGAVSAQKLTYVPYTENAFLTGICVSSNGKYVAGPDTQGRAFIANPETGEIKYFMSPDLEAGNTDAEGTDSKVNKILDDGTGYGYVGSNPAKFDFNTGEYTLLGSENGSVVTANADGSFCAGYTYGDTWVTEPCVWNDGVKATLPVPTDAWLGFNTNGYRVWWGSTDGSVLLGQISDDMSTYPPMIWVRNADGVTYSANSITRRFVDLSWELDGHQPFDMMEGVAVSGNGKWLVVNVHDKTDMDFAKGLQVARYDLEADTLGLVNCPGVEDGDYYYGNDIANDGTIVGYVENNDGYQGFIVEANSNDAKPLAEVYPTVAEFGAMDNATRNMPCSISPDGRYVEGYGLVDSPLDDDNYFYATWLFDRGENATGVEDVKAEEAPSKVVASYSANGAKLNSKSQNKGLVINRLANGKVRKTVR